MADSPSSILLLRLQSTGSNTNLWGGYINTALQTIEQASKGYQTQALTGDTTLSWTNYATGNKGQAALLKFTGSLSATATVTMPAYQNFLLIWNAAGQTVTVKCSGGTGVSIPNNRKALVFCDGTDYYSATPNFLIDDISEANSRDIADRSYVDTAIAAAGTLTPATVRVSGADTTAAYLGTKINATGTGAATVTQSIGSPAGNETVNIAVSVGALGLSEGGTITGAGSVAVDTKYLCDFTSTSYTITLPGSPTAGNMILLTKFGTNTMTLGLNGLKFNGDTANPTSALEGQTLLRYTGASRGWVEL